MNKIQKWLFFCAGVLCAGLLVAGVLALRELSETARRASCRPHLLLLDSRNFAGEHGGMFPPLSPRFGQLMFDNDALDRVVMLKDYLCEFDRRYPGVWRRFSDTTPVNDWSYVYLGYFLENEAQGMAFVKAYRSIIAAGGAFEEDLAVEGLETCHGLPVLYRLREPDTLPPEAACLASMAGSIPVIIEWPGNHRGGAHVVYLDGAQKFLKYPGEFPMTPEFIGALRAINAEI